MLPDVLCCPSCHERLNRSDNALICPACQSAYAIKDGVPRFFTLQLNETPDMTFQADQMFSTTLTARLFNVGKKIISSDYMPVDHLNTFIAAIPAGARTVELGSGNRRLTPDIVNIDLFAFPNVDIVADIVQTPLESGSVDYLVIDAVLEHVPEPHKVVDEIYRIVRPGGQIYCLTPFIHPYHGYPHNYFNFSSDALEFLFRKFHSCSVEVARGPTSALTNLVSEYFALALSGRSTALYTIGKGLSLAPIFLLKYLDKFWPSKGSGLRIANALYAKVTR